MVITIRPHLDFVSVRQQNIKTKMTSFYVQIKPLRDSYYNSLRHRIDLNRETKSAVKEVSIL